MNEVLLNQAFGAWGLLFLKDVITKQSICLILRIEKKREFKRWYLEGHLEIPLQLSSRFKTTLSKLASSLDCRYHLYILDSSIALFLSRSRSRPFVLRHHIVRTLPTALYIRCLESCLTASRSLRYLLRRSSRHPRSDIFLVVFILPVLLFLRVLLFPSSRRSYIPRDRN